MRRPLFFVIAIIILSLTVPQLLAQQTTTVLHMVDSEPLVGQELGLDDSITLYFDRALDCDSAQSAFNMMPAVQGTLRCDGLSLTFTPETSFDRANTYRVQLNTTLRGADGAQLLENITLDLNTVGFLQIAETFPAPNSQEVQADTTLTIIFNRPVVPLLIHEERDTLPNPITINPPLAGEGEWLNTSIYTFTPEGSGWAAGTIYSVTVNGGLSTVDGSVLPEDYVFSFETEPPQIASFQPNDNTDTFPIEGRIQVRFNLPMDQASVESTFTVRTYDGGTIINGTYEWADDSQGFAFSPQGLELQMAYVAGFDGFPTAANGDAPLTGLTSWTFETVPYPAIMGSNPTNGETEISPYYGNVLIYFASPMDVETLADKITISPEPRVEPQFYYRDWSDSYEISFPPDPSTTYTISVAPGMEDAYGNVIDDSYSFSYTTDQYDPEARLSIPDSISFYNAYREPTSVFITYRNMDNIDLSLYRVGFDEFGRFLLNPNRYYDVTDSFVPNQNALLRQWTIDGSEVPLNALRYDLLEFSQSTGTTECPAALPSQLRAGDTAVVIITPDPVRARSAPSTGEIVELMYQDYALPIVGEGFCGEEGLLWWPVQLRNGTQAWVAESVGDEYLIAPQDVETAPVQVTDADGGSLTPGVYYLRSDPTAFRSQGHLMVVSTANLVVKNSIDTVTVWATDVQSGQPLANVPITIYDEGYQLVGADVTNADGLVTMQVPPITDLYVRRMAVLTTNEHFGVGFSDWTDGIDPYQFGQSYDYYPNDYRIYMYTDRPVYRPGQPVYFRGVVRSKDDVSYTVPNERTIYVTIRDDRGDTIFSQDVQISPYGTFSGQLDLAGDASLGYYYVRAEMPSRFEYRDEAGGVSFSVAEYRLPEFQVEVTAAEPEVVQGDTVSVTVDSTYFFGGSVSNADVEYSVISNNYFFNYDGPGYYDFNDYNYDLGPSAYYATSTRGTIASGNETTNDAGEITIEIPAELGDATQSQSYTIEAVVSEESGQAVAGRTSVTVHQGLVYVGIRPESYVNRAEQPSNINILAVDWDSNTIANQNIDIEVVERRWSSVQEQDSRGRTIWTWEVEEIPVTTGSVTSDDNGQATFTFTPEDGGVFKIYATTRDERGNEVRSSAFMWVSSRRYVSWRQQNSNRIDLIADQDDYNIGDTAQILITSPFQGTAEALITVERGDVLETMRVTMDSNSYVYELPIIEKYAPNVYVSVIIVKGVDENNPVAAFRMGYIELGVETTRRELNIDITSDVDRASPQQTVTYTVRTTDWAGNPVPAEVGVGVTDLAALSLADANSGPILRYFYGDQSLSVRTSTALTVNTDQLTQETLDTVKGGGGGFLQEGLIEIRGEFVDTPYWNPTVETDVTGTATFDVRLPDNLTTWRLDARAVTLAPDGNMLVGQDTFDLLSTKPIIIRPVTPRFFIIGDEVVLAAVVNNNTAQEQNAVVTINATGVTLHSEAAQMVTVPADGRARVEWHVTVDSADFAQMSFTADTGEFSDGSISAVSIDEQGTLPIYRYEVPETVGTAGVLFTADTRVESIVLPQRFDVTQGTLSVQVDQSLAAATADGLDYLTNYSYYCTEQTVSRFLPNIMTVRAFSDLGLSDPLLEDSLNRNVLRALQKLYAEQHSDGGWGWFVQSNSNPTVTAYALIGLAEAYNQGYPVPDRVITNAQDYLRANFLAPTTNQTAWRANRSAFILYALARSGAPDAGRTAAAYEYRDNLSIYAKAMLAETFYIIDPTNTSRTDILLNDIANAAITSAAGVHWAEDSRDYWNWNTDTRTTALVLSAFTKLRPNSNLLPNIVRYLMVQRNADAWENTQETAWAVMALTDYMRTSGELNPDYAYNVTFNGQTRLEGNATRDTVRDRTTMLVDVSEFVRGAANELIFTRTGSNDGAMYYTAYLEAYLPVPEVEALDNGIILERRFSLQGDATDTPISSARVGDVVEVRLTVIVPNTIHYVMIESPHPAGAEAIDPNLNTSQQIGTRPGLDNSNPLRYGWGWWYFSNTEFRDEKVVIYADYLPAGTYEYVYTIRPSVAGTYNVIPATGQEFYFPDVYGRTSGMSFTILPADE